MRALLVALVLAARAALAQEAAPSPPPEPTRTAPVTVDGVALFRVRGISSYPAGERAAAIAGRIVAAARDPAIAPDAIRARAAGSFFVIEADSHRLMEIVPADAKLEDVVLPETLAMAYSRRIQDAVRAYREDRTPRRMLESTGRLAVAVLVAAVAFWIALRFAAWLERRFERRYRPMLRDVGVQAFQILRAEQLWGALLALVNAFRVVPALVLAGAVLDYGLRLYPQTRGFGMRMTQWTMGPVGTLANGFVDILDNLAFLAIWFLLVRYLLTLARIFFAALGSGNVTLRGFDPEWAEPTYRIVRMLAIVFALVVAFPYIPGSDSQAFRGLSLFIGVVFSLGSSSVIGNVIAGYTMTYRRAFRPGDRIRIGDVTGEVLESRLLVTRVRTPKNEEVVIPNSEILSGNVVNFSSLAKTRKLLLYTTVGIGYETPWRQVEAMLIEAAGRSEGVLRDPPPFVLLRALGDFAVTYELNVYTEDPATALLQYTSLHRNVLDVFNEHGVQIMTPAYEGDPPEPKVVPKEKWFAAPAAPPTPQKE
jgi:small-conductance mechanosensitive channel